MGRIRQNGNFFLCLLINMLLNLDGTLVAWILLALHIWLEWSILWFWLALGLWLAGILLRMTFWRYVNHHATPDRPRPNKNPYSVGQNEESSCRR